MTRGRPSLEAGVKRVGVTLTLHPEVNEALKSKARELAVKHKRHVSASLLVDQLVKKYIMKKRKQMKANDEGN